MKAAPCKRTPNTVTLCMNFLFRRFISPTQNRQFRRDNFDYGRTAKWACKSKLEKGILCERKKKHFNANFPKKKSVVTFIIAENKVLDKTLYQRRC